MIAIKAVLVKPRVRRQTRRNRLKVSQIHVLDRVVN